MTFSHRHLAVGALVASGLLWGATVALSKVALGWLDPAWLTVARFGIAAAVLAVVSRRTLAAALTPRTLLAGAVGFGASVALQNAGIAHTSVAHASVLMGVVPVLVALASLGAGHGHATRREWWSFALSALGIVLMTAGGGGGATFGGDLLILCSVALSAGLIAVQPRLLHGRDPGAVTTAQFLGAAGLALPLALAGGHTPSAPAGPGPVLAFIALVLAGTIAPFWLFAFGQSKVRPQLAGAFINLEPVVGAVIGWVLFADPVGVTSILGAVGVIAAIGLAASVRPLPQRLPDFASRAWREGAAVHAAMLTLPPDQAGPLRWRRRGETLELEGMYLPGSTEPSVATSDPV